MIITNKIDESKSMCRFVDILGHLIDDYACHQIECSPQVIQVFERWSHQLIPKSFT